MVENGRREDSQGSLSSTSSGLKSDFAKIFCSRCTQLRGLIDCSSCDVEKCITVYYLDIELFISKIIAPVMLPFCEARCRTFKNCGFHKRRYVQQDVDTLIFRCFLSTEAEILGRMISLVLVQPDNSLLSMACDRSVEDVFLNELVEVDPGYFKAIDTTCDGDIGTLTEEIMSSNPVDYAKARRLNITTVPKSVKKEFFFKEKIP